MKRAHMSDESIRILVHAFYEKLRRDPQLAPIFTAAIGDRRDAHIARMCDFWGTAMRVSKRYKGDMLAAHWRVGALHPALFGRWLGLFEETVEEHFTGEVAAALRDRAHKTARNLEMALFRRPDGRWLRDDLQPHSGQ